ncbi:hypothetical protein Hanom_Chr10g00935081 [Helianthus anomalus]
MLKCNCTAITAAGSFCARAGLQPHARCGHLAHCHARCGHMAHCHIKAPYCASSPTPRARASEHARVRVRVRSTLSESTSECFHETMRMERSYLNTPLSSISHPMWDKVPLPHIF